MARGKQARPARTGLAAAQYAMRREFAQDQARAMGEYDQRALTPIRMCIEYLMKPWWERLWLRMKGKRPDVRDLYWYETIETEPVEMEPEPAPEPEPDDATPAIEVVGR